jgi:ComF family protein
MLIDIVFPKGSLIREIELMTPTTLYSHVGKNIYRHGVKAPFRYKDRYIEQALWEIKRKENKNIYELFANCLYIFIEQELCHPPDEYIFVPIPLTAKKKSERGFNQCELLLKHMPDTLQKEFDLLVRVRDTLPQKTLRREQRLKNLADCFAVTDPKKVFTKRIVLIDDICTTGTTLHEARSALLKAGAKEVLLFAVAH